MGCPTLRHPSALRYHHVLSDVALCVGAGGWERLHCVQRRKNCWSSFDLPASDRNRKRSNLIGRQRSFVAKKSLREELKRAEYLAGQFQGDPTVALFFEGRAIMHRNFEFR